MAAQAGRRGQLERGTTSVWRLSRWVELATVVSLALIAVRPLVDLTGRYEGQGLNLGAVVGLVMAVLAAFIVLAALVWPRANVTRILTLLVLSAIVAVLYVFHFRYPTPTGLDLAQLRTNYVVWNTPAEGTIVNAGRFVMGFAPLIAFFALVVGRLPTVTPRTVRRVLVLFLVACAAPTVITWMQFAGLYEMTYFEWIGGVRYGRPSGGYLQPSAIGRYLIFAVVALFLLRKGGMPLLNRRPVLYASLQGIALATVFVSTHRTSLVIAVLVFLILHRPRLHIRRLASVRLAQVTGSAALVLFLAVVIAGAGLEGRALPEAMSAIEATSSRVAQGFSSLTRDDGAFLRGRGIRWGRTIDFLTSARPETRWFGLGWEPFESHNDLLRLLLVHGYVGTLAVWAVLAGAFATALHVTQGTGRLALWALAITLVLFGTTYHPTSFPNFMTTTAALAFSAVILLPRGPTSSGSAPADTRPP